MVLSFGGDVRFSDLNKYVLVLLLGYNRLSSVALVVTYIAHIDKTTLP